MSHFSCAVIIPKGRETDPGVVEELMAPYDENGEWFADGSRWDWWMVGGRWDGAIRGLEWRDITERCKLCGGTGTRPDGLERFGPEWMERVNGCNGCNGTGESPAWTTHAGYQSAERNVSLMATVADDYTPYAFVRPTGEWVEQSRVGFFGTDIPDENGATKAEKVNGFDQAWAEARRKYSDHVVVGLDCHV